MAYTSGIPAPQAKAPSKPNTKCIWVAKTQIVYTRRATNKSRNQATQIKSPSLPNQLVKKTNQELDKLLNQQSAVFNGFARTALLQMTMDHEACGSQSHHNIGIRSYQTLTPTRTTELNRNNVSSGYLKPLHLWIKIRSQMKPVYNLLNPMASSSPHPRS